MFTGGREGVCIGAIKEETEARDWHAFCLSLSLAQAWGRCPPRLQPHLERRHSEVDTAVGVGLQGGQGAPWRQQREGLQQTRQHHEELQACQRLAQAHTCPAAKGQCTGACTRGQKTVCRRRTGPESAAARTQPVPLPPTGSQPHHAPGQNSCGRSQTVSSRWAPWRLGMTTVPSGMS